MGKLINNLSTKKLIILLGLILLVIFAVLFIFDSRHKSSPQKTAVQDCFDNIKQSKCPLIKEASSELDPEKVKQLSVTVKKIETENNYEADPSLVYAKVILDINITDAHNARNDLNILKNIYKKDIGYDTFLGQGTMTPDQLETIVKQVENSGNAFKSGPL